MPWQCLYEGVRVFLSVYKCVVYMHVCEGLYNICVSACLYIYSQMCVLSYWLYVYGCVCVFVCFCKRVMLLHERESLDNDSLCAYVCVCMCVYLHALIMTACAYVYVCVSVSVCVCVFTCNHMKMKYPDKGNSFLGGEGGCWKQNVRQKIRLEYPVLTERKFLRLTHA